MRHLDLFSGIGGFALAARNVWGDDHKVVSFCDIKPFAQKVLQKHWPDVPCHDDIKTMKGSDYANIDLLTGGFPCQDVSVANMKYEGITGDRSGLWKEMYRLIDEIRPRYALMENVAALIVRGFDTLLLDLAKIGYDAEWQLIRASQVGAFHRRERIWVLAYPKGERSHETREIQNRIFTESSVKKPKQWKQFLSIPAGAYTIDEQWKEFESIVCGNDDGLPTELDKDRLKGLGNAIVPQVAEQIFRAIDQVEALA